MTITQNRAAPSRRTTAAIRAQLYRDIKEGNTEWLQGPPLEFKIKRPPTAPVVSPTLIREGRLVVEVGLKGTVAAGRRMVLELADWERVRLALGDQWGLRAIKGHEYVVSRARPVMVLARWIVGARADQAVSYRGSPLDLRRCSLVLEDRREFMARSLGQRKSF